MNRFAIAQPKTYEQAQALLVDERFSLPVLKGGGMDLVDQMKEGLIEPDLLIDVRQLIPTDAQGLAIPARTTLADLAQSRTTHEQLAVVAQAAASAATPQVRNVATVAGNLMQRPRCWYYRHAQFDCLKKGGDTCYAVDGENRFHAIFGDGPCHIVLPSNLATAFMVCDANIHLMGGDRESIHISELYHLPDQGVSDEANLQPDEIITHVTCRGGPNTGFYAIKEKQSFDWPLAMAAVALQMNGNQIDDAQVCAGAVAPIPWPLPKVGAALRGVNIEDDAALKAACAHSIQGAAPMSENGYKLKLLPIAVRRAVLVASGRDQEAV
jgi:xanthine dehydrogenase YagS FAD-binding subunit